MNQLGYIFLAILFLISLFILLREVFCWYYKINKVIELLEKILYKNRESNENIQKNILYSKLLYTAIMYGKDKAKELENEINKKNES
ncbi:MAG TPA: hypothetical protein PLP19_07920 [bacterium]|nr:hypothetical protein [bacterium]HPN43400.1 hypothetical protein [bacterium]